MPLETPARSKHIASLNCEDSRSFSGDETCRLENKSDREIWRVAKTNHFTIVTFDSDFLDLSVLDGQPPKIILIRTGNITTRNLGDLLLNKQAVIKQFIDSALPDNPACLEIIEG